MKDFLGNDLNLGDIVLTTSSTGFYNWKGDIFEFGEVFRFNKKSVVLRRLSGKKTDGKHKRVDPSHVFKVDPAEYTMYVLAQSKESL